jgi:alkaline phosphatase
MKCIVFAVLAGFVFPGSPARAADAGEAKPTYVIVMIADGVGFNHFEAASLYRTGKRDGLPFQKFPVSLAASTYPRGGGYDHSTAATNGYGNGKHGATDSAAAATALATGFKTANGWLGMTAESDVAEHATAAWETAAAVLRPVARTNVMEAAERKRLSTGVVSSVPFSHATPAGFVAHAPERGSYTEIVRQMLASPLEVVVGCGHPEATNAPPPETGTYGSDSRRFGYVGGAGTWTQIVTGAVMSDADGDGTPDPWTFVQDTSAFISLASGPAPRRLLGVPRAKNTLQQARPGDYKADPYVEPLTPDMPTLADLSRAALNVLDDNPRGFVLMIEGGATDWASHGNQSGRMIEEALDFADAVDAVTAWVDSRKAWDRTLLIVTSDHETGGLTGPVIARRPWWFFGSKRTSAGIVSNGKGRLPGLAWNTKGHTNQLVPLYAKGMAADKFTSAATGNDPIRGAYLDNTDIAKIVFGLLE